MDERHARGRRWLRHVGSVLVGAAIVARALAAHAADGPGRIERFDLKTEAATTKVILMLSRPLAFDVHVLDGEAGKSAQRLVLDFADTTLAADVTAPKKIDDGFVRQIRTGTPSPGTARVVLDLASDVTHAIEAYETPPHVTITIAAANAGAASATTPPDATAPPPASEPEETATPHPARSPKPQAKAKVKAKATPARGAHAKSAAHPRPVPTPRAKRSK